MVLLSYFSCRISLGHYGIRLVSTLVAVTPFVAGELPST